MRTIGKERITINTGEIVGNSCSTVLYLLYYLINVPFNHVINP